MLLRTNYDSMHAFRGGMINRSVVAFRDVKRTAVSLRKDKMNNKAVSSNKNSRPASTEIPQMHDASGRQKTNEEMESEWKKFLKRGQDETRRVFSDKNKRIAEKGTLLIGIYLSNQACRDLPKSYFPQGALSTEKISNHELPGLSLLYLFFLQTTIADVWLSDKEDDDKHRYTKLGHLGNIRANNWVGVFDDLLLIDSYLRNEEGVTEEEIQKFEKYVPPFLRRYCLTVNRQVGAGMKFPKLHWLTHAAPDQRAYGGLDNVDGETGESNLKRHKDNARKTQQNALTLDNQSASRNTERLVIDLNMAAMSIKSPPVTSRQGEDVFIAVGCDCKACPSGIIDNTGKKTKEGVPSKRAVWHQTARHQQEFEMVEKFLKKKVIPRCEPDPGKDMVVLKMPNYIKNTLDGTIYRAQPEVVSDIQFFRLHVDQCLLIRVGTCMSELGDGLARDILCTCA